MILSDVHSIHLIDDNTHICCDHQKSKVEDSNNQNGYIIKSDKSINNWIKTDGQIPDVKAAWKFAFGQNGKIHTIVNQQISQKEIASSIYFKYIGSIFKSSENTEQDVTHRIQCGW